MSFGDDVRKARTRRGLTQKKVCEMIRERFKDVGASLSVDSLKAIESGRRKKNRDTTVEKIIAILPEVRQDKPK